MRKIITKHIKNQMLQRMLVYAFSDGISRAMPFLVLPVIANYLSVADFGLVTNFTVLVELFAAFVAFSAAQALAVDYYKTDRASLISNLIVLNTTLFIITFLIIVFFHGYFFLYLKLSLKWQIYALLSAYFNCITQLYNTKLRYDEKAKLFGTLQFLRAFFSAGLSLLLVIVLDWSWEGRAFSLLVTGILLFIISVILLKREKIIFKNINFGSVYAAFLFGLPLLPQTTFQWLRSGFEKILITKQLGLSSNGLLSFSGTIASVFLLFTSAFFSAYTPYLFKSLAEIEKEPFKEAAILKNVVSKVLIFFSFLIAVIVAGNFGIIYLISSFFNTAYQGAGKFIPFALVNVFFSAVTTWLSYFLLFKKKTKLIGIITVIHATIQVFLTFVMVTKFEAIGALYASLISTFLLIIALVIFVKREYALPLLNFKAK